MAASSPLVRLRRLALAAVSLGLALAAPAFGQIQTASLVNSSAVAVKLSTASIVSGDCATSFSYANGATTKPSSGSAFQNCTLTNPTSLTLFFAAGVSYASGDLISLKVNQTALRNATNSSYVAPNATTAVQPVLLSATLTSSSTITVKLPLASAFAPANASVCNSALVLQSAAGVVKADSFAACTLTDSTTVTLTLAANVYAPGDGLQVVFNQSVLLVGTTGYAPSDAPTPVVPVILTAVLTSAAEVTVSLPTTSTIAAGTACNAIFVVRNVSVVIPNAISTCVVTPGGLSVVLTLANASYFAAGVNVNLYANQTALRAGLNGPLYIPAASNLAISPTIVAAVLYDMGKLSIALPVASTFPAGISAADCAGVFTYKRAGSATAAASPFTSCTLASNSMSITIVLAVSYVAGDTIDVAATGSSLTVGSTSYSPRALPVVVRPALLSATMVSASSIAIVLPTASVLATPFTADDCNVLLQLSSSTGTAKPAAFSACSISTDGLTITATLSSSVSIIPGDKLDVSSNQWKLRAGTLASGPAYVPFAGVAVLPGLSSAVLTNSTQLTVTLPSKSQFPAVTTLADCHATIVVYPAGSPTAKTTPFSACSISADGTQLVLTLASASFAAGDTVDVASSQTKLFINATGTNNTAAYVPRAVPIHPTFNAANTMTATLTTSTTVDVVLPFVSSFSKTTVNATDCNAAFDLLAAVGTFKTSPFSNCALDLAGTKLTLTLSGAYSAGDKLNVKAGNSLLRAGTSAVSLYAPAASAITIQPTLVWAAVTNLTIYVKLPTAASLGASFACNSTVLIYPSGSSTARNTPFASCSLSSDSMALVLTLTGTGEGVFATGDRINLAVNQGNVTAGSVAFIAAASNIAIAAAAITEATLTTATTLMVKLPVVSSMTSTSADDCNAAFQIFPSATPTVAKTTMITGCTVASDGLSVTFTLLNSTIFTAGDAINVKGGQSRLLIDASGPAYTTAAASSSIQPILISAVAIGSSTIEVVLPANSVLSGAIASAVTVSPSSSSSARALSSGSIDATSLRALTVVMNPSGAVPVGTYAAGDTIDMVALQSGLTTGSVAYKSSGAAVTISPSITSSAFLYAANTLAVTLPISGAVIGADCNSYIAIYPNASTTPKSSPISACNVTGNILYLTLSAAFASGDTINIKSGNTGFYVSTATTTIPFAPRLASQAITPALAAAVATSSTTVVVTLPTASTLYTAGATPAGTLTLSDTDCANVITGPSLAVGSSACSMAATASTTLTLTTSPVTATTTVDISANNAAGTNAALRQANATGSTAYTARSIPLKFTLAAAAAVGNNTISVTLPVGATFYSSGSAPAAVSALSATDCADILNVGSKAISSCSLSAGQSIITVTLASSWAPGDTINIVASHPATGKAILRAGSSSPSGIEFIAATTAITITPSITSAVVTAIVTGTSSTIEVGLSVPAYLFTGNPAVATATLTAAQCSTIFSTSSISSCAIASSSSANAFMTITRSTATFTPGTTAIQLQSTHPLTATTANAAALRASSTISSPAFTPYPPSTGNGVLVSPSILSAIAVDSVTIKATLTSAAKFVTGDGLDSNGPLDSTSAVTNCNDILQVFPLGSTTPKALASSSCSVSSTTLTITLAPGGSYAQGDRIMFVSTHGTSATKAKLISTTGSLVFMSSSSPVEVKPALVSATLTTSTTVDVVLPVASAFFAGATPGAVASLTTSTNPTCTSILKVWDTSVSRIVTNCDMTNAQGQTKFTITISSAYVAGDVVDMVLSQAGLRAGTATTAAAYVPSPVVIKPVPISATATASNTFTLNFPVVTTRLYDGSTYANSVNDCTSIIVVASAAGVAKSVGNCAILTSAGSGTGDSKMTVTMAAGVALAAGDTVALVSTHGTDNSKARLVAWGTAGSTTAVYAPGSPAITIRPTIVSVQQLAPSVLAITLPMSSAFFKGTATTPSLTLSGSECAQVFTYTKNDGSTAKTFASSDSCTMYSVNGETMVNITLNAAASTGVYANPGDKINIKTAAPAASDARLVAGTASTGPLYTPLGTVITVVPDIVRAVYTGGSLMEVVLPYNSALQVDVSATTAGSVAAGPCGNAISYTGGIASGGGTADCNLAAGGSVMTVSTTAYTAGTDTVQIVNTDAAAAGPPVKAVLALYAAANDQAAYAPGATVKVAPSITSVYVQAAKQFIVNLPVPGSFYPAGSTTPTSTLSLTDCNQILYLTAADGTTRKNLAASNPCVMSNDGLTITVNTAADYASGDNVNIISTHPAAGAATLRASGASTNIAFLPRAAAMRIYPVILSALAEGPVDNVNTVVEVPTPVSSSIFTAGSTTSGTVSATCDSIMAVAGKASTACTLANNVFKLTIPAWASGDVISVAQNKVWGNAYSADPDLRAVPYTGSASTNAAPYVNSGSLAVYSGKRIKSAQLTGPKTITISLPQGSSLFAGGSSSPASTALATAACSHIFIVGDGTQTIDSCQMTSGSTSVTVTLTSAYAVAQSGAVTADAININTNSDATIGTLRVGTSSSGTLYLPRTTVIDPVPISAIATGPTTVKVTLPISSAIYTGSSVAASDLASSVCDSVFDVVPRFSSAGLTTRAKVTAKGCSITNTGSTTLTAYLDAGNPVQSGDMFKVIGGSSVLRLFSGGSYSATTLQLAYKNPAGGNLVISPTIASATPTSLLVVQVTMSFTVHFVKNGAPTATLTGADCGLIFSMRTSSGSTDRAIDSCSVPTTGSTTVTITMASGQSYAAGDKMNIITTQALMYGYSIALDGPLAVPQPDSAYYVMEPKILSADALLDASGNIKVFEVTLPVPSILYAQATDTTGTTSLSDCSDVVSITGITASITSVACSMSDATGQTKLTVTTDGAATLADLNTHVKINIAANNGAADSNKVLRVSGTAPAATKYATGVDVIITPTIISATLTDSTTVVVGLLGASYMYDSTGTSASTLAKSACDSILAFTAADGATARALAATNPCALTGAESKITATLAATYVTGDLLNLVPATEPVAASAAIRTGNTNSGRGYTRRQDNVVVRPTIKSAIATSSSTIVLTLSAAGSFYDSSPALVSTLTGDTINTAAASCNDILAVFPSAGTAASNARALRAAGACVIATSTATPAVTTVTVTLASGAYTKGDKVNVLPGHPTASRCSLRASAAAYANTVAFAPNPTDIVVSPVLAKAVATAATTIRVTLPVASTIYIRGSNTATDSLNAANCADVLTVVDSNNVAKTIASCTMTDNTGQSTLTVTLGSTSAFAPGDKIDISATNGKSGRAGLYGGTANTDPVYISHSISIQPGYLPTSSNPPLAVTSNTVHVTLPYPSYLSSASLSGADCALVLNVLPSGLTTPKPLATDNACSLVSSTLLKVVLSGTYAVGDKFNFLAVDTTKPYLGIVSTTGPAYDPLVTDTVILATMGSAVLASATTVVTTFPLAPQMTGSLTKTVCDSIFAFADSTGLAKTTSPVSSCVLSSTTITITLNSTSSFTPGDTINLKSTQAVIYTDVAQTVLFKPANAPLTILPAFYGTAATLTSPLAISVTLPAVSAIDAGVTTAQCNSALAIVSGAGATKTSPIATCAMADATTAVLRMAPTYTYANGETVNAAASNAVLRMGAAAGGPVYQPAAANVPIFATLQMAMLTSYTDMMVTLPTPSAVPANFSLSDCQNLLTVTTSAGASKNVSLNSCQLSADKLSLAITMLRGSYAAGDKVNVKAGQGELRVADMGVGSAYIAKAVVVAPALFANATLVSATSIVVALPLSSAVSSAGCAAALTLVGTNGVPKNSSFSACSLAADKVTLTLTLTSATTYKAGDVVDVVASQTALTLDDGATAYVPSPGKAPVIMPTFISAALTNATIITVALPTASVLTSTAAADCNAAVVIARNGSAVASPLSACAVSADGMSLTLTAAATYKPMAGDTVNAAVNQTVLRAGSASGPAYVPRATAVLVTVPSPPPSPPPSPAPSPPPLPPLSTANYSARGLATGPLSCNVLIGDLTVTTTSGNFTGMASYAGKDASYKGSCKDAVTGAVYTDDTVASTLPAGLTGLVLSPVTALASVWDLKSVADLANTNKDYLRLLGVPVNASAYGTAVQLLAYDYYVKGFVALETPAVAVLNVEGMVAANLLMYTKFFDGLNASVAGRDITAAQALAAGQYALAAVLEESTAPINTTDPASILALLNVTYSVLTANATSAAAGRRLLQTAPAPFTQLQAQATALAAAAAGSNALVAAQQARLITAINAGTSISAAELTNIINEASKVIVAQSTVIANAATGLGSGAISPASFTSSYTGSALSTLVAQQQLAATPGSDVTAGPAPSPPSDDKKSNTGLIVGLVVGLVGGAIVITLIVVFIVMRRRKQNVAAAGQATA